jgi:hypothetical protein
LFFVRAAYPRSKIQILAFNFLDITLAYPMLIGFKVTLVSAPIIGVITANAQGLKQGFQGFEQLILAFAKHSGQYVFRA